MAGLSLRSISRRSRRNTPFSFGRIPVRDPFLELYLLAHEYRRTDYHSHHDPLGRSMHGSHLRFLETCRPSFRKLPQKTLKVLGWCALVLILFDLALTCLAILRYVNRTSPAFTALGEWIDKTFPDSFMRKHFPSMKIKINFFSWRGHRLCPRRDFFDQLIRLPETYQNPISYCGRLKIFSKIFSDLHDPKRFFNKRQTVLNTLILPVCIPTKNRKTMFLPLSHIPFKLAVLFHTKIFIKIARDRKNLRPRALYSVMLLFRHRSTFE